MPSKHRVKKLEKQLLQTGQGDEGFSAEEFTAEEWLEVFMSWEQHPDFAANEHFMRYLGEYRGVLARARGSAEPWEPPADYMARRTLNERRRRWRKRHGDLLAGLEIARYGVLAATHRLLDDEDRANSKAVEVNK